MADKRKNTRAYMRANPNVPMYTDLPQGGRKNQNKKRIDPNPTWKPRGNAFINSQYQLVLGREYSSLSFESKTTRLLGSIFSTPLPDERVFQDKDVSMVGIASSRPDPIADMNYRLGFRSSFDDPFNPRVAPYVEPNLIDLDYPTNS